MTKQLDELADGADKLSLTVTTYPVDGALKLWLEGDDALDQTASIYVDPDGNTVWLCGWLLWYFNHKPTNLFITKNK